MSKDAEFDALGNPLNKSADEFIDQLPKSGKSSNTVSFQGALLDPQSFDLPANESTLYRRVERKIGSEKALKLAQDWHTNTYSNPYESRIRPRFSEYMERVIKGQPVPRYTFGTPHTKWVYFTRQIKNVSGGGTKRKKKPIKKKKEKPIDKKNWVYFPAYLPFPGGRR